MLKTIAFHSNQLSIRGTEVALYDYADFFEHLYQGRSLIVTPKHSDLHDARSAGRFAQRFSLCPYTSAEDLDNILIREKVDLLYCIKAGFKDAVHSKVCRNAVHAVFPHYEPHGDVYAYISAWLSQEMRTLYKCRSEIPYVPHILRPAAPPDRNLRDELQIPKEALVFGRYGGPESFDIGFVRALLPIVAERRSDIYFLFANTPKFCADHQQILHLDGFSEPSQRTNFIQCCDAMLHARERGETFGMSTAEFALLNRPVFTWSGSAERAHLEYLGERAIKYDCAEDLAIKILSFVPQAYSGYCPYAEFTPEKVMEKFMQVFAST